jgi:hypothetical protein
MDSVLCLVLPNSAVAGHMLLPYLWSAVSEEENKIKQSSSEFSTQGCVSSNDTRCLENFDAE